MDKNIIRSLIFLAAGLIVILFPKQVNKFQTFIIRKLHLKLTLKSDRNSYTYAGLFFIVIAVGLFIFAMVS